MSERQPLWGQIRLEPSLAEKPHHEIMLRLRQELKGLERDLVAAVPPLLAPTDPAPTRI